MTDVDGRCSAIGIVADGADGTVLVPRRTHLDGAEGMGGEGCREGGLRLLGAAPAAEAGALVAVLGDLVGDGLSVSAVRTANVADVFDHRSVVGPASCPVFERPVVTAVHDRWEAAMIREGRIVSRRRLRVSDGSWRVVVAAPEPDEVRAELEGAYGGQLTLVRSAWTLGRIDAIRRHLAARIEEWGITVLVDGTTAEGLGVLRVGLHEVTEDVRMWREDLPPGAVELYPFVARGTSEDHFSDESRPFDHSA